MKGQVDLFGFNDPTAELDPYHARTTDPIASHVTVASMSTKRLAKVGFCLYHVALTGSATAAEIAFEAAQYGIHRYPKPNFVAHWLEDGRNLGWFTRPGQMRNKGMVHVTTDEGQHQAAMLPPLPWIIEVLR